MDVFINFNFNYFDFMRLIYDFILTQKIMVSSSHEISKFLIKMLSGFDEVSFGSPWFRKTKKNILKLGNGPTAVYKMAISKFWQIISFSFLILQLNQSVKCFSWLPKIFKYVLFHQINTKIHQKIKNGIFHDYDFFDSTSAFRCFW